MRQLRRENRMSEKRIEKIRCPKCGGEHEFTIWNRINTELDPDLREKVISGELFRTVCPSCGQTIDVIYPCLYHQMGDKFMIYYAPGQEAMRQAVEAFREGTEEIGIKRGSGPDEEGYTYRVVGSLYDLQEKIAIFEAGLDDRAIEICKVYIGSELQESQKTADFDDLRYYRDQNGHDRIALMKEGNAFASSVFPRDLYKGISEHYKALIERHGGETVIDMNWVMNSVSEEEKKQ